MIWVTRLTIDITVRTLLDAGMLCELVKVLDKLVKVLHVNYDEVFPLSFCII